MADDKNDSTKETYEYPGFLKEFFINLAVFPIVILFVKWPQFPATWVGWLFVLGMSLVISLMFAAIAGIIGPPKLLGDSLFPADFLRWLVYAAICFVVAMTIEDMLEVNFPNYRTVHWRHYLSL